VPAPLGLCCCARYLATFRPVLSTSQRWHSFRVRRSLRTATQGGVRLGDRRPGLWSTTALRLMECRLGEWPL
jgi:hypothetical protein